MAYRENKGGRPPKWQNPQQIQELGEAYFLSLQDEEGKYIKPPTITGLAIALGTTRNTLVDYEEKDEFLPTIKGLKSRCEEWVEENALMGKANATFSIFNLKNNYGWKDRTETDLTSKNERIIFGADQELSNKYGTDTSTEANS